MAKYIDKAELIKEVERKLKLTSATTTKVIDSLPTIEIVHCRDCKYWQVGNMDLGIDCHTYPDHFCAEGERKDDNNRY